MKRSLLISCLLFLFASCSNKDTIKKPHSPLNSSNLRLQQYQIDPTKDTVITGLRGGIFRISAGTFNVSTPIILQIKEVYSPLEILYAGMITESNGQLLESGGMVYVNAISSDGKNLQLLKPMKISIPANYVNDEMKLFKGVELPDGTVNWVEPVPLDSIPSENCITGGRLLYQYKCASCHKIFSDATGPALFGMEQRVPRPALRAFIRNPGKMLATGDPYFNRMKKAFGSVMTAFPDVSDTDIDCIIAYINNWAERRPDLAEDTAGRKVFVSSDAAVICPPDSVYVDSTRNIGLDENIMDFSTSDDIQINSTAPPTVQELEKSLRSGFTDRPASYGRYDFSIQTLGWFNVDAAFKGLDGTVNVDLFVNVQTSESVTPNVYIFFPNRKLLSVGEWHADKLYHFEKDGSKIPLYPGDNGIAFAFTSVGDDILYGLSPFKVKESQTIRVTLRKSSKEEITGAFRQLQLDGIDLDLITKKKVLQTRECFPVADTSLVK